MFYLLVELNSYRQLRRLKPTLVTDIEQRMNSMLADCGASAVSSDGGQHFFCFDSVRAGEHEHILDTAVRIRDYLEQHAKSLAGFSVYLDVSHAPSSESPVRELRSMALRTAIEEEVVVSEAAAIAIEPYARLDKKGRFFVVGEKHERPSVSAISYQEFLSRDSVVERILDACDPFLQDARSGAVLIHGPEDCGKGIAAYRAAERLYGGAADGHPLEIGPMGTTAYAALASGLTNATLESVEAEMTPRDRAVFTQRRAVIDDLRAATSSCADSRDADIAIAFRCIVFGYIRSMERRGLPAFILCYAVHRYDQVTLDLLQGVFKDLEHRGAIVLLTAEKPFLPMALREVSHQKIEVRSPSLDEWRSLAQRVTGPAIGSASIVSTVRGGHAVFHTLVAERAFSRDRLENRLPPSTRLLSALDDEYIETMTAIALVDGALTVDALAAFMAEIGVAKVRTPELVNDLQRLGYLRNTILLSVAFEGLADALSLAFPATTRKVSTAMAHFLQHSSELTQPVYSFLLESGDPEFALATIQRYIHRLLERRRLRDAQSILYGSLPTFPGSSETSARSALHLILYVSRLRLALLSRDEASADRVFPGWRNLTIDAPSSSLHGDYLLTKAQYLNAKGSRDEGLALVKKAILAYQDADDPRGVARANAEFGLVLLSQGSISAARDYFSISSRTGAQLEDRRGALHAGLLELGTDVSLGNLSRAREGAVSLRDEARRLAVRQEELYLDFLLGRIAFEIGNYETAEPTFATALSGATVLENEDAVYLLKRWLARSVAYRGAPRRGLDMLLELPESRECLLFRVEALILLGQYGDASELAEEAAQPSPRRVFRPGEAIAWETGFANIEDRSMDQNDDVISHLTSAYGAYARAEHGSPEPAIEVLHRLTRAGGTAIRDPYASLYLLLYSEILPENGGEDLEDMVTILGKSVKHLQERTSRIDSYADKTSFLRNNYWNALLTKKAKHHNLV